MKVEKDKPICFDCSKEKRILKHHLDKNPKNNSPSNIRYICHRCHSARHLSNPQVTSCSLLSSKDRESYSFQYNQLAEETQNTILKLETEIKRAEANLTSQLEQLRKSFGLHSEFIPLYSYPYPLVTLPLYSEIFSD